MAAQTVQRFFEIERKTIDGLNLAGSPKQYEVNECTVTRNSVQAALAEVATAYAELRDCMAVATSMLIRLDTIRDEARLHLSGVRRKTIEANARDATAAINTVFTVLGSWEDSHTLYLR